MASYTAGTTYDGYTLRLDVSESNVSTANNTSVVNWTLYIVNGGRRFDISSFKFNVQINGTWVADYSGHCATTDVSASGGVHYLSSGSITVWHESDGSKTVYCYASCNGRSNGHGPGSGELGGNFTLTTIARAPSYTSKNATNITEHSVRLTGSVDTKGLGITGGGWDISTNGGSSWTYYAGGPTDKTITGLNSGTQYWYRGYVTTAGGGANSGWGTFTTKDCVIRKNINGTWKICVPYKKINGTWKKCIPYIKVNGTWKEGIN